MIYLIDDKKTRQIGYGWTDNKLSQYSDIIKPIYNYDEIKQTGLSDVIFSDNNIILFHESFFDGITNIHERDSVDISNRLENYAKEHPDFYLAKFSGSKNSRVINDNVIHLPVSILYQNLEIFSQKLKQSNLDLRYLLFGENYLVEETLIKKLNEANNNIDDLPSYELSSRNLFIRPFRDYIQTPLNDYVEKTIFNKISDEDLSIKIQEWLMNDEYDNVFIPISFGPILSDFNGLRFAMHIRCTDTPNRLKNIFLYSFVDYSYLINNKYFDILKTKNVQLIDYRKSAFQKALETSYEPLTKDELPLEIKKVKLDPPANYEDSHSIANEWAIYRWANAINAKDEDIEKIIDKVNNQLYFKYLSTIYPVQEIPAISENQLKINYTGTPKILYIDDELEKGWHEIFAKVLGDYNNLFVDSIGEDFKKISKEEIISKSVKKIKEDQIDLVILDFRLHPDDFNVTDIHEITGLKLLNEIKNINPGIQVIIFSATNKIWNLQELLRSGADGFIAKESPENSVESNFTKEAIDSFISSITTALERTFLKQFFEYCNTIENQLFDCETEDATEYDLFIKDLKIQLNLIKEGGKKINLKVSTTLDVVFLNCYNFLEKFKHHYLKEKNYQFVLGIEEIEMNRYLKKWKKGIINEGKFIRINKNDSPSWFNTLTGIAIDYFEIANIKSDLVSKLNKIKDFRNNYIHGTKPKFKQDELLMILNVMKHITKEMKE